MSIVKKNTILHQLFFFFFFYSLIAFSINQWRDHFRSRNPPERQLFCVTLLWSVNRISWSGYVKIISVYVDFLRYHFLNPIYTTNIYICLTYIAVDLRPPINIFPSTELRKFYMRDPVKPEVVSCTLPYWQPSSTLSSNQVPTYSQSSAECRNSD